MIANQADIDFIVAQRHLNGADLWTTADKRIYKGAPFSALESVLMLAELGAEQLPIVREATELIWSLWRPDGRFKIAPQGAIYPCHTANVARVLCRLGLANDERLQKTFEHLLNTQHTDGGWRCNALKFGRGPETEFSNPGTTLAVLDAFRFTPYANTDQRLNQAVESLLNHWETRVPLGPCHYGIGALFMQVEFPFFRYNLFFYVYVLSFYKVAQTDRRFLEALEAIQSKTVDGQIIVKNPNRKLNKLEFCKKNLPSQLATMRYRELMGNLEG